MRLVLVRSLEAGLRKQLAQFCGETQEGQAASFGIRYLNLPQLFFMDRGEYISTRLEWEGAMIRGIEISVINLHQRTDSLAEFLERMIGEDSHSERSFLTFDLRNISHTTKIPQNLYLYREISVRELLAIRPDWERALKAAITKAEARGLALYGLSFSAGVDLRKIEKLAALCDTPGFVAKTAPLDRAGSLSQKCQNASESSGGLQNGSEP